MSAGEATREYYREQGRKQEQQRIIKLLEDQVSWLLDQNTFERTAEAEVWIRATKLVSKERNNVRSMH